MLNSFFFFLILFFLSWDRGIWVRVLIQQKGFKGCRLGVSKEGRSSCPSAPVSSVHRNASLRSTSRLPSTQPTCHHAASRSTQEDRLDMTLADSGWWVKENGKPF